MQKIIIIGAGPTGLAAAHRLKDHSVMQGKEVADRILGKGEERVWRSQHVSFCRNAVLQ
jgi:cation diffusion facilitator CzcD-associated flavoprotein CzcO